MSWNPFAPQTMADPAVGHAQLLSACPVHHFTDFDPPFYTLSHYHDVVAALRDIETYSSQYGQGPRFTDPIGMLCDPPNHTYYRSLVQQAFTPKQIGLLQQPVETLTDELLDIIVQRPEREFDLHDDLAFPLPVTIIAAMLGVPTEDLERFKHWSDVQVAAMGAPDPSVYAEDSAQFAAYMHNHLSQRRAVLADPATAASAPDDLLTLLAGQKIDGQWLEEAQVLSVLNQLLVGGNETTTSLITNAVWRLLETPGAWQQLVQDPALADAVIEESLRFDPPVLGLYRNTTAEVTVRGVTIPANAKVFLNYAAANRDPEVYATPNLFDPQRSGKQAGPRHLAFGLGVHFCLGAPMARLEAKVVLQALARRLPTLSLRGPGERITPFFLWGRRKLPVGF